MIMIALQYYSGVIEEEFKREQLDYKKINSLKQNLAGLEEFGIHEK